MSAPLSIELTEQGDWLLRHWSEERRKQWGRVFDKFLDSMAAWMMRETGKGFDDEAQPGGDPWEDLATSTFFSKLYRGNAGHILVDSNDMRMSISQDISHSKGEARVGSPVDYSLWHQIGTSKMPARPFLPEHDYAEEHAVDLFTQLLRSEMRGGIAHA